MSLSLFSRLPHTAVRRLGLLRQHLVAATSRAASTDSAWAAQWSDATEVIHSDVTYHESGEQLRKLIGTGLLKFTDLRDDPEKFFHAHRVLARHAVDHGPGFWIRFTVQYNLFAGTIVAAGGDEQLDRLAEYQRDEQLGCFGLTEKLAGVQSGLVVNTTCKWDEDKQVFILHTPDGGAKKNWISQGYVADKAVVLANLHAGGQWRGPHAFVMDFRGGGKLCKGVTLEDMGSKTTGNDLDNAAISFDQVELQKDALLNRYADIIDNEYVQTSKIPPFAMIGQRLYTGRVAVAQAALAYQRRLFQVTKKYSDNKQIVTPGGGGGTAPLSSIPQLRAIYAEADEASAELEAFVGECERQLSENLKSSTLPSPQLVHAIAVAKVRAVETSIALCFKLKQEVGSFALMADSGFKHMDFLQCCKFAEGDSRILMQKMARDRFRAFTKAPDGNATADDDDDEVRICNELVEAMAAELELSGNKHKAWDDQYELVYELAEATMDKAQAAYRSM